MTYSQTPKTQKPTWFRWDLCVLWGISMQKLPLKNTLFCPFCKEMQRFCKGKNMISYCKSIGCKKTLHFCIFAFLHLYGIRDGGYVLTMQKKVYSARARQPTPLYKKQTPWHGRKILHALRITILFLMELLRSRVPLCFRLRSKGNRLS